MKLAYTVSEAASEMGLDERTVRQLIREGKLIARKCSSERGIRIGYEAIKAFFLQPDPELITVAECSQNCSNPRPAKPRLAQPSTGALRKKP